MKSKQVINTVDGKCLGHISDVIFDVVTSQTLGFVVPQNSDGFWGLFKSGKEIFIPYNCVCKIGVDSILVELYIDNKAQTGRQNPRNRGCGRIITLNNDNIVAK